MTKDEKVELAGKVEGLLVGITSSEWSKWSSCCGVHGLEKAIKYAKVLLCAMATSGFAPDDNLQFKQSACEAT